MIFSIFQQLHEHSNFLDMNQRHYIEELYITAIIYAMSLSTGNKRRYSNDSSINLPTHADHYRVRLASCNTASAAQEH
jgi:hypothetical protein